MIMVRTFLVHVGACTKPTRDSLPFFLNGHLLAPIPMGATESPPLILNSGSLPLLKRLHAPLRLSDRLKKNPRRGVALMPRAVPH